jgi:hypothetical protein
MDSFKEFWIEAGIGFGAFFLGLAIKVIFKLY